MRQEHQDLRIDYVEFAVKDIAAAKAFYGSAFGWTFQDYGDDYSSFHDGRLAGGFRSDVEPKPGGPLVVIYALDLAAAEKKVMENGGSIAVETFEFPGGRRFEFTDPSGNRLAVWSDR
ncbi:MAG: VOC family protein [Acidobacteriota bacterium]|nr:VOC family protein [Acidobacteriota bacterium]